jgi:peptidoglycan/xylan/chitin deacetylase (PgdA/CDA1 family)
VGHEIRTAHHRLRELTGTTPTLFAYPNGNWDSRVERELEALEYTAGFLFDHRRTDPDGHPLRRSRLRMNPLASADRCRLILSGLHPALHRMRGRP